MKKLFLTIAIAATTLSMWADLKGNGYYRVQNYGSQRWAFLQDNKGAVDNVAGTADVHSLGLTLDYASIITDPASIVYITDKGNSSYDIAAQGTSLQTLMGYTVNIKQDGNDPEGNALYRIYGVKSGVIKYMCDLKTIEGTFGDAGLASAGDVLVTAYKKNAQWVITPVAEDSENYFATIPTINAGDKGYSMLYTSFPYSLASEGMKAYYIARTYNGMAEMVELSGEIPGGLPVIIQCAGSQADQNKMNVLSPNSASIPKNALTGVYFDFLMGSLENQVKYDPATMRVLGTCADGSLGFITASGLATIPSNSAYLKVPAGSPAEFKCVDQETFTAGVDSVTQEESSLKYSNGTIYSTQPSEIAVYNMSGQIVAKGYGTTLEISGLQKGVYIARSAGKSLKIMVN